MPGREKPARAKAFSSFRMRLSALVVIALVPVFAVTLVAARASLAQARGAAEARARALASAVIKQQALLVDGARLVDSAIAKGLAAARAGAAAGPSALAALYDASGLYSNLLVAGADGMVGEDALGTKPFDVSDREYFARMRAEGAFVASGYLISRSTGFPSIVFALPVAGEGGGPGAAVIASFRLDSYARLFAGLRLGEGISFEILDRDGLRLFREPEDPAFPPGRPADPAFFAAAIKGGDGLLPAAGGVSAYETLSIGGEAAPSFVARVEVSDEGALGGTRAIASGSLIALGVSALLAIALAWVAGEFLLVRRLGRLAQAARRFVAGDRGARAGELRGGDEISGLARDFDAMAEALEARVAAEESRSAQLAAALAEKEVLLKEVHHRVKNNFQTISSLLSLQAETVADPATLRLLKESEQRIHSMALIHETLYRSDELSRIDFGEYLGALSKSVQRNHPSREPVELALELDRVELGLDTAIPLGLAFNEMLTNAFKHAFGPGDAGRRIVVKLARTGGRAAEVSVADNGRGLPPGFDPGRAKTLGVQLISMLAAQARGMVEFSAPGGGARVSIRFAT